MFSLIPWRKERNGNEALATRTEHPLDLFRTFDRMMADWFRTWPFPTWEGMATEFDETEKELIVRIDAPGFEPNDFDIRLSGDVLEVKAEHAVKEGDAVKSSRKLSRRYTLPSEVDPDKVEASYKNGVLELKLTKAETARWHKIEVKTA